MQQGFRMVGCSKGLQWCGAVYWAPARSGCEAAVATQPPGHPQFMGVGWGLACDLLCGLIFPNPEP